jgi:Flp pilus assembly protein TadD
MDESADLLDADACLQRAHLLHERNRPAEAAEFCRRGLGRDPHHPGCLALLAQCLLQVDGREEEALRAAYDAVTADPENAHQHTVLAFARSRTALDGQDSVLRRALGEVDHAVSLDPDHSFAHVVRASILARLGKVKEAEAAARRALELDPDDMQASSILSAMLVQQGRQAEHAELAEDLLARGPDDPDAHIAAGFNYLQRGDHAKANEHFREALRLEPNHEGARMGLIESFRARSWMYRLLIRFNTAIQRISAGNGQWVMLGGYVLYRTLYRSLQNTAPVAAALLLTAWLILALWSHLARGMASFFMLFDRRVRPALRRPEIVEGLASGVPVVLALAVLGGWIAADIPPSPLPALSLFLAATVCAGAASNDHHIGKWIYAAAAAFVLPMALLVTGAFLVGHGPGWIMEVGMIALTTSAVFTWVRGFGLLYR